MVTWNVMLTHSVGLEMYDTGSESTAAGACAAAIAAVQECHERLPGIEGCRYTIEVDGALVAIIATGVEESGAPAHHEVAELLSSLGAAPTPPALNIPTPCPYGRPSPTGAALRRIR